MTDRETRIRRLAETDSMTIVAEALYRGDDWSRAMAPGYLGRACTLKTAETRLHEASEALSNAPISPARRAAEEAEAAFFAPSGNPVDPDADVIRAYLATAKTHAEGLYMAAAEELTRYVAQIADRRPDLCNYDGMPS